MSPPHDLTHAESPPPAHGLTPSRRMRAKFLREVRGAQLLESAPGPVVEPGDIEALPPTAQRFLVAAGVLGRPRTRSVRAHANGAFRLGPDKPWMRCEAWQYDSAVDVTRIFHMRLRAFGVVPMLVRDTYVDGRGRMLGRVLDAVSVVDEGDEHVATGELVTWLNDACFLAPSMLLRPEVTWRPIRGPLGQSAFDLSLTDRGRVVSARVFVDDDGTVADFSTTDRFVSLPGPDGATAWARTRWSTPVHSVRVLHGRTIASGGRAVWHLPTGNFAYADLTFDRVEFDVSPGADA